MKKWVDEKKRGKKIKKEKTKQNKGSYAGKGVGVRYGYKKNILFYKKYN